MDGNKPKDLKRAKIEAGDSETKKIVTQAEQSKEKSAHKMTLADLIKHWGTSSSNMPNGGKMTSKKYATVKAKRKIQKQSRKRNRK